jgi:2-methylcitrate dehydratase
VTAILADGQRIVREVDHAPGFAARPMTRAEVERKLRGNAGDRWPRQTIDDALRELWVLEGVSELSALLGRFARTA